MDVVLESQEMNADKQQLRRALLPVWIKIFGWLFIVMGGIVPFLYLGSLILGFSASYTMFGLEYEGAAQAFMPFLICCTIFINGLCAYGLLFGKDWGLTACIVFGYFGLALTVGSMVFEMFVSGGMMIRLEPLIKIPYLIKLNKLKGHW